MDNVIKLQNGDVLTFVEKLKGKHVMKFQSLQGEAMSVQGQNDVSIDVNALTNSIYKMFDVLCIKIESNGKEVAPNLDYIEDLEIDDFNKVVEILSGYVEKIIDSADKKKD